MRRSKIIGTGRFLPERVVSNFDLEKLMDTSDKWITERTGIRNRRFVEDGTGSSELGYKAAIKAIEKANLSPKDIDFIIAATLIPDYFFPGNGCLIGQMLGLPGVGALDVRNQCSGFIYALSIADSFIQNGVYDNILVVGSEVHSVVHKMTTEFRDTAVLFGDGGGAVVLTSSEDEKRGILSTHLHADGTYAKDLWLEIPGSKQNPWLTKEMIDDERHHPKMNGKKVFKHAVKRFPEVIKEALEKNSLTVDDISLLIPHQSNLRITQAVAKRLGLGMEKIYNNIDRYGNTTAASIPIALDEAVEEERIKDGDIVIFAAFGAGFTWASAAIRW